MTKKSSYGVPLKPVKGREQWKRVILEADEASEAAATVKSEYKVLRYKYVAERISGNQKVRRGNVRHQAHLHPSQSLVKQFRANLRMERRTRMQEGPRKSEELRQGIIGRKK